MYQISFSLRRFAHRLCSRHYKYVASLVCGLMCDFNIESEHLFDVLSINAKTRISLLELDLVCINVIHCMLMQNQRKNGSFYPLIKETEKWVRNSYYALTEQKPNGFLLPKFNITSMSSGICNSVNYFFIYKRTGMRPKCLHYSTGGKKPPAS